MPVSNQFRHQNYPTRPEVSPVLLQVSAEAADGVDFTRLHTDLGVREVLIVPGTFMGDDPFGVAGILRSMAAGLPAGSTVMEALANAICQRTKHLADSVTGDVGNYSAAFQQMFQQLVGEDPVVRLLHPPWTGQNHHLARADLAVRLFCVLTQLPLGTGERVLLWGHSHAGNAFAILSNLLANERDSVEAFFAAAGNRRGAHWTLARQQLASSPTPHPLAESLILAAFGTPVRYGWDCQGYHRLVHFSHHRNYDQASPFVTTPLFPAHSLADTLSARYGDWVQAFGITGTDAVTPISAAVNRRLAAVLEAELAVPEHGLDTRFLFSPGFRDICARWKTGTRCHADGENLLLDYEPCGRKTLAGYAIEEALLGHGVATTLDWLPTHLALLIKRLDQA